MSVNKQNSFNLGSKSPKGTRKTSFNQSSVTDFKVSAEKRKNEKSVQAIINRASRLAL